MIFIDLMRFYHELILTNGLNLNCHFIIFSFGSINLRSHIFEPHIISKVILIDSLNAISIDEIAN